MTRPVKCLGALALAAACLLGGCAAAGDGPARYQVAMVAKSTETDFWESRLCRGRGRRDGI